MDEQTRIYTEILERLAQAIVDAERCAIAVGEHEHFIAHIPRALRKIAKRIEKSQLVKRGDLK
jgi:hypothetical protein